VGLDRCFASVARFGTASSIRRWILTNPDLLLVLLMDPDLLVFKITVLPPSYGTLKPS
jgi:hypothetical protein